ncbi:uncharacterized protein LOC105696466 [Orussus abietinus]|uniref:uncharacterized protein LOC105696466 n=1 Tax=Orussus abietinus TaxID=222816 RepID=UPI000C716086|nr:uncharacterized protein LOC105696466 [Orussus abietinus]
MSILLILLLCALTRAEMCLRILKNKSDYPAILRIPGRIRKWNSTTKQFELLEALALNRSAICSVQYTNDMRGKTITVATDMMLPYVMINANNTKVSGYIGDVWTTLEETLKFKTIYRKEGLEMFQLLFQGRVDAVLAASAIHSYSAGYYTYSTPVTTSSYALFVQPEGSTVSKWWYSNIFSYGLWLTTFLSALFLAATIMMTYSIKKITCKDYVDCDDELAAPSFNLLCVLGGISGQGFQKLPTCWSLRVIVISSLLMGMLLSCGFSSTLTSSLASKGVSLPLTSLQDVSMKRTHSLCIRNDSTAYLHLTTDWSPLGELRPEWKGLVNNGCPDMRNRKNLASELCQPGMVYLEAPDVFFSVYQKVRNKCSIVQIPGVYWRLKLAILHARAAKHRHLINDYLLRLRSVGILTYLEKKWISKELHHDSTNQQWRSFSPVEYEHIHVISLGLFAMMIISVIICIAENIYFILTSAKKKQLTIPRIVKTRRQITSPRLY